MSMQITRAEYEQKRVHEQAGPGTPLHPDAPGYWLTQYGERGTELVTGVEVLELDAADAEILAERTAELDKVEGPRVGDYVRFADGVERRASFVTPADWLPEVDSVQTSDGGSWYLGSAYVSFSGGLCLGVPRSSLTLTDESKLGAVWFFHHDYHRASNGVVAEVPFHVYECSSEATL